MMHYPKVQKNIFRAWWQGWIAGAIVLYLYVWIIYRRLSNDAPLKGQKFWIGFIACALVGYVVTILLVKRTGSSWKTAFISATKGTFVFYFSAAIIFALFIGAWLLLFGLASL